MRPRGHAVGGAAPQERAEEVAGDELGVAVVERPRQRAQSRRDTRTPRGTRGVFGHPSPPAGGDVGAAFFRARPPPRGRRGLAGASTVSATAAVALLVRARATDFPPRRPRGRRGAASASTGASGSSGAKASTAASGSGVGDVTPTTPTESKSGGSSPGRLARKPRCRMPRRSDAALAALRWGLARVGSALGGGRRRRRGVSRGGGGGRHDVVVAVEAQVDTLRIVRVAQDAVEEPFVRATRCRGLTARGPRGGCWPPGRARPCWRRCAAPPAAPGPSASSRVRRSPVIGRRRRGDGLGERRREVSGVVAGRRGGAAVATAASAAATTTAPAGPFLGAVGALAFR